jgi:hypothetical protein
MSSAFDNSEHKAYVRQQEVEVTTSPVKGKNQSQNAKLEFLSSSINNLQGSDANKYFHQKQNKGEIIDLVLDGLGPNFDEIEVKKIANVKHVISSEVDIDALKGVCKGTGRIKIRLNEGEDKEQIR